MQRADDIQQRVEHGENHQTVVKNMWDGLTKDEQSQWDEDAKEVNLAG